MRVGWGATLCAAQLAGAAAAQDSVSRRRAKPEAVGMSAARLARVRTVLQGHVDAGRIPGAVAAVARRGEIVFFDAFGWADVAAQRPMTTDAIFRVASMTKAFTAVAAMMLHEEQGFPLRTPVSRWLPEFAESQVAVRLAPEPGADEPRVALVAATRPPSVLDLLRHTAGLGYQGPPNAAGKPAYRAVGVEAREQDLQQMVARLARAPLYEQPGTRWRYGYSIDVLGRAIEVMTEESLDAFLFERLFAPLGLRDTGFFVPEAKHARLTTLYTPATEEGLAPAAAPLVPYEGLAQDGVRTRPRLLYGGAGAVSTAGDYLRFAQMLLNGGELGGVRVLSRNAVELMSRDHLGDRPRHGSLLAPGDGFGLSFRVTLDPARNGQPGSVGAFGWGGATGTRFWIDPSAELVTVFMVQILPHKGLEYGHQFRSLVYKAIVDGE